MNLNGVRGALKPSTGHICFSCLLRGSSTNRRTSRRFLTVTPRIFPTPEPPLATASCGKPKGKNGSPTEKSSQTTTSTTASKENSEDTASKEADISSQDIGQSPANPDKPVANAKPKQASRSSSKRKERRLKNSIKTKPLPSESEEPSAELQSTKDVIKKAMELAERLKPQVAAQKQELKIKDKLVKKTVSTRARLKSKSKPPVKAEKVTKSRRVLSLPMSKLAPKPPLKVRKLISKGPTANAKTGTSLEEALSLTEEQRIKHLAKPDIRTSSANDLEMTGESVCHVMVIASFDFSSSGC